MQPGHPGMSVAQQMQQAQMMAMQQARPQGFGGYGFQGYPSPYVGAAQGAVGSFQGMQGAGGDGFQKGGQQFGKGKGKGGGKGKGKGKGKSFGFSSSDSREQRDANGNLDPRRQIEMAQRRAKHRDRGAVAEAQRAAILRFEKEYMGRLEGTWYDEQDGKTVYTVEGNTCSVSSGENSRVYRNRLTIFNGDICWDATRFWQKLSVDKLPPAEEEIQRIEWTVGEGSQHVLPVVWTKTRPEIKEPESKPEEEAKDAAADATAAEEVKPSEEATA